jgi:biofilm PGA synthesis lipoprotein PgaB
MLRVVLNGSLRVVAITITLLALAVPAFAYWTATRPPVYGLASQVTAPIPAGKFNVAVPHYAGKVLILCYHDLSDRSHNEYTVTPEAFASQMAALHRDGFHTISAATFVHFLDDSSVRLPSRPLLITFDDGAKGTWIYADPVLRRLHYRATVFLITGDVSHHQPYYLDWAEVEAMHRSGRWDFGSHTSNGHGRIPVDGTGTTNPFLTNREWLADQDRLETLDEYRARVTADINRSITDIVSHGLPRPRMFAYPFSAFRTPTNDPAVPPVLDSILKARFRALMDNVNDPTAVSRGMSSPLPRVEVYRTTTTAALLKQLATTITAGRS